MRAFKARKIEEGLNPNTVGVMQGVLSAALNQALDDGMILTNPTARVKKAAKRGETRMHVLSEEEASRLVSVAKGTRDEALILVALKTFMRQGELAALKWEDVEGNNIVVWRSADTRSRPRVSTTKTGRERRIPIGPRIVATLEAHRKRQLEERLAASSWADPGLIFPNTVGKIRIRATVVSHLRALLADAGLPAEVRFHDLRHTGITLALKRGIPVHAIAKIAGHSDPPAVRSLPRRPARSSGERHRRPLLDKDST